MVQSLSKALIERDDVRSLRLALPAFRMTNEVCGGLVAADGDGVGSDFASPVRHECCVSFVVDFFADEFRVKRVGLIEVGLEVLRLSC